MKSTALVLLLCLDAAAAPFITVKVAPPKVAKNPSCASILVPKGERESQKILNAFARAQTVSSAAVYNSGTLDVRNNPGYQAVLTDLLLELDSSYGHFRVLAARYFNEADKKTKARLKKQLVDSLNTHLDDWFPSQDFRNEVLCYEGPTFSVRVGPSGIEGFEFPSMFSVQGFLLRGGAAVFDAWNLSYLKIYPHLQRDPIFFENASHRTNFYRGLGKLKTLKRLVLDLGTDLRGVGQIAESKSLESLSIATEELLDPEDLNGIAALRNLKHVEISIPIRVRRNSQSGIPDPWYQGDDWLNAIAVLQKQKPKHAIDLTIVLRETFEDWPIRRSWGVRSFKQSLADFKSVKTRIARFTDDGFVGD